MNITVNETTVQKLLAVVDTGLVQGLGSAIPGKMCVEAAVCYAFNLPHGDNPPCVGQAIRGFKIRLNDSNWSSNLARAAGMRKLAVAQLGSEGIDQKQFADIVALKTIQQVLPVALDAVGLYLHAQSVRDSKNLEQARMAVGAAREDVTDAYLATHKAYLKAFKDQEINDDASTCAAVRPTLDAATITHEVAAAVEYAATVTQDPHPATITESAESAARIAAKVALAVRFRADEILNLSASIALETLKELKSPGCEFLYLCD